MKKSDIATLGLFVICSVTGILGGMSGSVLIASISVTASLLLVVVWALFRAQKFSVVAREIRTELRNINTRAGSTETGIKELAENQAQLIDLVSELQAAAGDLGRVSDQSKDLGVKARLQTDAGPEAGSEPSTKILDAVLAADAKITKTKSQLNRVVRRQVEVYGLLELVEGRLTARVDQFLYEAQRELRKNQSQVSALQQRIDLLDWHVPNNGSTINGESQDREIAKYLYYLSYQIPKEIEAMHQLRSYFAVGQLTPLMGGWALSPSGLLDIITVINRDAPDVVVECGSGTSTIWIASALRANGRGHIFALEHDPSFAAKTRQWLHDLDLDSFATVLDAPIVRYEADSGPFDWYEVKDLYEVSSIDVLVIDGPPKALGHLRGAAIDVLRDRLSPTAHVFMDDVNRDSENELINTWLSENVELTLEPSQTPVQAHLLWTDRTAIDGK